MTSSIIHLVPKPVEPIPARRVEAVTKAAFGQRRKKLKNVWASVFGERGIDLLAAAKRAGIDLSARGETLDVGAFERMAAELRA